MSLALTKSKLLSARQCAKRLWLETHKPNLYAEQNGDAVALQIGLEVGQVARSLYPGGSTIGHINNPSRAVQETAQFLKQTGPLVLFEAAFSTGDLLSRADIFQRNHSGETRIVEVKASSSVKDIHLVDCAIQFWIANQSGNRIDEIYLAHIDTSFVYPGGQNYKGLLTVKELTSDIKELVEEVPQWIDNARQILEYEEPTVEPGAQCRTPYPCPFLDICNQGVTEYPISILPTKRVEKARLLEDGYEDVRDIPPGYLSNSRAEWIREVTASGEADLKSEAGVTLRAFEYPRYYLDFETVAPAVPKWAHTRPYESLPFQWSCHIETEFGSLGHQEFLAEGHASPIRDCAESLLDALGATGPVFTYSSYERSVIKSLATRFADLEEKLDALLVRLVDLLPTTKAHYYHPELKGSWSIKSVLPTITTDLGYDRLSGIKEGLGASEGFLEMIASETEVRRKRELRQQLLEYCRLDTLAMVKLAHFLSGTDQTKPVHRVIRSHPFR